MKNEMQYFNSNNAYTFGIVLVIVVLGWLYTTWQEAKSKQQLVEIISLKEEEIVKAKEYAEKLKVSNDTLLKGVIAVTDFADSTLAAAKEVEKTAALINFKYEGEVKENKKLRFENEQLEYSNNSFQTQLDSLKTIIENQTKVKLSEDRGVLSSLIQSVSNSKEVRRTRKSERNL